MNAPAHNTVVILDYGSQYTQLIARRVRESHVYCEIHPCTLDLAHLKKINPSALILSGGPDSVFGENSPKSAPEILELGVPTLGICYGEQLMAHQLGGLVEKGEHHEYGRAELTIDNPTGIFTPFKKGEKIEVWMSHGDRLTRAPEGFHTIASSPNAPLCAIEHSEKKFYGIQFHPEVAHTPRGTEILKAFLFDVAGLKADWTPGSFVDETIERIKSQVASDEKVICGLSGGVDSSVAAILCHKAIGDQLVCIFVDNGLLRKGEFDGVQKMMDEHFDLNVIAVDARRRFLDELKGVTDPEKKRKIIGRVFIEVFDEEAKKIDNAKWLVQGTLYPDVIESVSVRGPSAVIKSHHNVGGLPDKMNLKLIEPLRELFKDEVRAAGKSMGMPHDVLWRHPFPGPGLGVRCLGELKDERLAALREADAIVDQEVRAAGLYSEIWQSFAVLLPVKSVGVMGDSRTYEEACVIRAISSTDGMTADWSRIPHEVLAKMSTRIINEVRGINRVAYDISSKPPATVEWE